MDLTRKMIKLEDGREISVFESNWEASTIRTRIEEKARADRTRLNGSGDPVLLFFLETFYSYLGSCSSGTAVPTAEEALALPDHELDNWYRSIVEVNPDGFIKIDFDRTGEVVFRNGKTFRIVSSFLPSVTMKRARLEEEALQKEPDRKNPKDVLAVYLYPLLASCSIGEVPSIDELRSGWPETEIYKWRDAIEKVNPHLFGSSEERTVQEAEELTKKKEKRRARS